MAKKAAKKAAKKSAKKPESNESKVRKVCRILGVEFEVLYRVSIEQQVVRVNGDDYGKGFSISVETNH